MSSAASRSAAEALVSALVRIESVNPSLDPGGSGEGPVAQFVATWLREQGLEVEVDEPAPGRPSVIARKVGSAAGPSLLLTGHLDTVATAGEWAGLQARREGNCLYGRGAYDMKGAIAAILLAVEELDDTELGGDLVIGAVSDEEARSLGTVSMLARIEVDAAIVTEPTALDVAIAHKGFAWFSVETIGRAAHGSSPGEGRDSIVAIGAALARVSELSFELAERPHRHPLLGTGSIHASTIEGGGEWSTYPARCRLELERRTIPGEGRDLLETEFASVAAAAQEAEGVHANACLEFLREPFEVAAEEPLVQSVLRCANAIDGVESRVVGYSPWTDAALLAAAGIPTVVFGPGGEGAHAEREWVDLGDVQRCAKALAAVARDHCGAC